MANDADLGQLSSQGGVAVVGVACRLPRAADPAAFWRLLRDGVDAITEVPVDRWDIESFYDRDGSAPGTVNTRRGGFLDRVDGFDAGFFGVAPREARVMDPQQRLMAELAWEALEDARLIPASLAATRTGVFVGAIADDYATLVHRRGPAAITAHTSTGLQRGIIANRVSYLLGLRGPSITVDTAQSSSLVAVHLAVESLLRDEVSVAVAGGVQLNLTPESTVAAAKFGGLSPDGRCHTFDARANGYVRGEGGGAVVLKPLAAALAAGDPIYCVIRGSAVNNDGATPGLTVPNPDAQRDVVRQAYERAGIPVGAVQYVELHGTGTKVGDPVEATALDAVFDGRDAPLHVGSAKTNVGHLEGAAGIVGLLKVALSIRHGELPASLNFSTPNPAVPMDHLRVRQEHGPWPRPDRQLVAGVSSFGMGGTNCHLAVTEAPARDREARPSGGGLSTWLVSGRDRQALRAQAGRLREHLRTGEFDAADVAFSLATTRTMFEHRAAVVGAGQDELLAGLAALSAGQQSADTVLGTARQGGLAFLFSGQGSQRAGMGRELYEAFPAFAEQFDEVVAAFDGHLARPLREVMFAEPGSLLNETEYTQPALFTLEVALFRLLARWGLRPDFLAGHSVGELAAAHVAGVFTLADAATVVAARGRLMQSAPSGGAMLAVRVAEADALPLLAGYADRVGIAAVNGPASIVLSGDEDAVERLGEVFAGRGHRTRRLRVSHAFHSPHMDGVLARFRQVVAGVPMRPPAIPIVSSATGTADLTSPDHWVRQLRHAVRFHDCVTRLVDHGVTDFVEVGPDGALTALVRESPREVRVVSTGSRKVSEARTAMAAVARAHTWGHDVDWRTVLDADGARVTTALPTYAFQRQRYWLPDGPDTVDGPVAERAEVAPADLLEQIRTAVAIVLGFVTPDAVDTEKTFKDLGFDSLTGVELSERLSTATGVRLPGGLIFDHPTPLLLAGHLRDQLHGTGAVPVPVAVRHDDDPVVIVGMGCRYPGGADDPESLWRLLRDDADVIGEFPTNRGWDLDRLYNPDPDHPGTSYTRHGGFLHDADEFDPEFFGISPREALAMDPQQRLLLETTWETLENAGIAPGTLHGTNTGVFVGAMAQDYGPRLHEPAQAGDGYLLTGGSVSVASGRIAYTLGLEGPAVTVDTACSSSLVAVHLAGQALRAGECDLAVAGGATVMASPGIFVEFSRQRGLAPDGRCKPFSASADGTGWSEGVGLVLLARLSDARRNGYPILAVVRGSAINQDGASNGLTAPNGPSQQRVIRQALANAGLSPTDIDAVEAHGTGTTLGDPIEAGALLATFGRDRDRPLWLGSLKSNIGHTQAAAGVAGLIKMVLALRHETLPSSLHADSPSPHVDWTTGDVHLLSEAQPWPVNPDRPRRAGISSFGISGTNAHVILEQPPTTPATEITTENPVTWVLSARTDAALEEQARALDGYLAAHPDTDLGHVAATLARRTVFEHRAVLIGTTLTELREQLTTLPIRTPPTPPPTGKTVFVFPGQGSQWAGMAADLLNQSTVFAEAITECQQAFQPYVDWSLTDTITNGTQLDRVDVVQPALFAVMIGLARLWQSIGIQPDAVIGHSQGEIAAAHIAGALSLDDAASVVTLRAQAIATHLAGRGGMASIPLPANTIELPDTLHIAAHNSPNNTVIAGEPNDLKQLVESYQEQGVQARLIDVDYASHTPHVEAIREDLLRLLAEINARQASIPFYSTVTAENTDTTTLNADYWYNNLRHTVHFEQTLHALANNGHTTFIETSPHPVLLPAIQDTLPNTTAIGTLRRNHGDWHQFLTAAASAHVNGTTIDWTTPGPTVDLPTYPFQRRSYWLRGTTAHTEHPLSTTISTRTHPWLADHAVLGTVLLPGTAFLDLALHTARQLPEPHTIDDLTLEAPLAVTDQPTTLHVSVDPADHTLTIHSHTSATGWTRHATATITPLDDEPPVVPTAWEPRPSRPVDELYTRLADQGYEYGPAFQGLDATWRDGDATCAEVSLADELRQDVDRFAIHPALLDAALHAVVLDGAGLRLPFAWRGVRLYGGKSTALRVRVTPTGPDAVALSATDASGTPVLSVEELSLRAVDPAQLTAANALFTVDWRPIEPGESAVPDFQVLTPTQDSPRAATEEVLTVTQNWLDEHDTCLVVHTRNALHGNLAHAPVWGLIRTAQAEHPDRFILLDTDEDIDDATLNDVLASGQSQLALRQGVLTTPRLTPVTGTGTPVPFDPDATVLITGGTGALATLLATHLVTRHGVRHLLLASRTGPDHPRANDIAGRLTELGATVTITACDTADPTQLAALLDDIPADRPLRAVIHTAGALHDATYTNLTPAHLDTVFRPKVDTARHLHDLTQHLPLTHFILFSSITGTIGNPGQANYAAANTYLETLAHHRTRHNLPATVITWGLWRTSSSLTANLSSADHARMARNGIAQLDDEHGLRLFDAAIANTAPVVVAAKLNRQALRDGPVPPVFLGLVGRRHTVRARTSGTIADRVATLSSDVDRKAAVLALVAAQVATVLGHDTGDAVDEHRSFKDAGFDSLTGVELRNRLGNLTGLRLPATVVFDYPTPDALARHLLEQLLGTAKPRITSTAAARTPDDPIAIVGIACRYPGGVHDPESLWRLVDGGGDAIGDFPTDRGWDLDALYHPDPDHAGTCYTRHGGFLYDADQFDPAFFGISPREALAIDPQQRLLLETAWEALEHAGIDPGSLRGSNTGVFAGVMYNDYGARLATVPPELEGYLRNGSYGSVASGRIAYTFGFEGPAVTVDTACSSSLVAIHLAGQALRAGECDLAVAGGVTVMATPATFVEFSRQRGLSPDGRCKPFAAAADGTGFGEGAGLLLLRRLSDAERDGQPVLAVIRGSAVNQDGASNGLTAPNGPAQERVIRQALAGAGLTPKDVDAVEAHGTGTTLGDPIEAGALLATYGQDRTEPLWLGSVKSNLGHTQAAAGVAGVIKMVQAMRHDRLPTTLHVDAPSPHVAWDGDAVRLLTGPRPWPARPDRPRRAGVSSFGISGTNAHLILEQPPAAVVPEAVPVAGPVIWPLSAHTDTALRAHAGRLHEALVADPDLRPVDVGWTLAIGRAALPRRAAVVGTSRDTLLDGLAAVARGDGAIRETAGRGRTAFLFSGQGSQRTGMGRELYAELPSFAAALDEVLAELDQHLPRPLTEVLFAEPGSAAAGLLDQTWYAQAGLFAVETALFRAVTEFVAAPDFLIGHSIGELSAAHAAGVVDLPAACALVAARGRLMQDARSDGLMVAIEATEEEILGSASVAIAAVNGPLSTVISGDHDVVARVARQWREAGRRTKRLTVSHAFHSAHMDSALDEFRAVAAGVEFAAPRIPVVSNVTGVLATPEELASPEYWVRHARGTVRFLDGMRWLAGQNVDTFVEVGPDGVLSALAGDCVDDAVAFPVLRPDRAEGVTFATAVARAHARGVEVDLRAALPGGRHVVLPPRPFQRSRFWLSSGEPAGDAAGLGLTSTGHPLLGAAVELPGGGTLHTGLLTTSRHPWLADHGIGGEVVVPGAALAEVAMRVGDIAELTLHAPILLGDGGTTVRLVVDPAGENGERTFTIQSRAAHEPAWTSNADGVLATGNPAPVPAPDWPPNATEVSVVDAEADLAARGYDYGPAFGGVTALWRADGTTYAAVQLPEPLDGTGFAIHPALLDAVLRPLAYGSPADRYWLPFSWRGVRLHVSGATSVRVAITRTGEDRVAIAVTDPAGTPVLSIDSLTLRPVDRDRFGTGGLYELGWAPTEAAEPPVRDDYVVADPLPPFDPEDPVRSVHEAVRAALDLVRDWLADDRTLVIRAADDLAGAAVRGLVRSAQNEHPGRFVLVHGDTPADVAMACGAPEVAMRDGRPVVPRLVRATGRAAPLDLTGTVLITGASGQLGALVARHLADRHGVDSLLLVSRRGREPAGIGAQVTTVACDVTDRDQLAALLATHPVSAVVHAAGVVADATVDTMTPDQLDRVLRVKVDAAWHLHELLPETVPLILFSSVAGTLGTAGQANYAAGNAFMDALAGHRASTRSIVWGLWSTAGGMGGRLAGADVARLGRTGVGGLSVERGLALFDAALTAACPAPVAAELTRTGADVSPVLRGLVRSPAREAADGRTLRAQVRGAVAAVLGHATPDALDGTQAFQDLGFDSLMAIELRNRLSAITGVTLPATVVFDHPTPDALTAHLEGAVRPHTATRRVTADLDDPVVIVGMGCRYPGGAADPESLWRLLANGTDAITEFPTNRGWDLDGLYDPDPEHPGTSYTRHGGFLHDADQFDPEFFGVSPREAVTVDPQHRLLLETTWQALENATIDPRSLRGSVTGVFTGVMYADYATPAPAPEHEGHVLTGVAPSIASGRVAYTYGFEGPAITVDTACSSSLVAVHLAAQALRSGECDLAVAGGATVMATPTTFVEFSRQRGLAPDGRCKAFSASADGTGWSEGVGLLVLERLSDAKRHGHHVLAVVRGSAINQDGASNGLTAPNGPSQQRVIHQALTNAGLTPTDIDAVEAHGTGTTLGDPIEAGALLATYGHNRDQPLWLGSVKSNLGHTQAAAGAASLIKMILALQHHTLPATLHADTPSPHINWDNGIQLLTTPQPWPANPDRPRRAGISSFGISGTNAHLILEEAEESPAEATTNDVVVWPLSARTESALEQQARNLDGYLTAHPDTDLGHVAATLARRTMFEHRAVLIGTTLTELREQLTTLPIRTPPTPAPTGKTVFVFPGQGSQWAGMAADLLDQSPVFAETITECEAAFEPHVDWSLVETITNGTQLDRVDVVQPALFAVMVALARLWQSTGIQPDAVIGHSQGEIAAAHIAGALTLNDAARIVTLRAQTIATHLAGHGGMASIPLPATTIELPDTIEIAAHNSPNNTVVAGEPNDLKHLVDHHQQQGIQARLIDVDYASHTAHVETIHKELIHLLADINPQQAAIPFYSTLTGGLLDTTTLDADYWYQNLRHTVHFEQTLHALANDGHTTFIETSPHPVLLSGIQDTLPDAVAFGTLRRNEGDRHQFLTAAATAHVNGVTVDWNVTGPTVTLPTYPFQRDSYWLHHSTTRPDPTAHPLLATTIPLAGGDGIVCTGTVSLRTHPWLADHAVLGTVLFPGTAFLDLALHAIQLLPEPHTIDDLTLESPLTVTDQPTTIQLALHESALTIHSRTDADWVRHATATIAPAGTAPAATTWAPHTPVTVDNHYDRLAAAGYDYGPAFQNLRQVWRTGDTIYAEARLPGEPGRFETHPALLDSLLHALAVTSDGLRLPFVWKGVRLHTRHAAALRAVFTPTGTDTFAVTVTDLDGRPVATIDELVLRPVDPARLAVGEAPPLHVVEWVPTPVAGQAAADVVVVRPTRDTPRGVAEEILTHVQNWLRDERTEQLVVHTRLDVLAHAPVRGLVRVVQAEHPGRVVLLDTDEDMDDTTIARIVATGHPQLAFQDDVLTVPRLTTGTTGTDPVPFEPDGTVLITGGTGGMASALAAHLVEHHGVRHLLLASRSGPDHPRANDIATHLTGLGATVTIAACDTADRTQLAALLGDIPADHPLRAVIHTAGALRDAPVTGLTADHLDTVFRPKVDTARHLHELTRHLPLTHFILFSSIAGTTGNPGQANYAAANTYLEALAQHRKRENLPATAVAWGLWQTATTLTRNLTAADHARIAGGGIAPIAPAHGMAMFDHALVTADPVVAAVRLHLPALREQADTLSPLLADLVPATSGTPVSRTDWPALLAETSGARQRELVLSLVQETVATVLKHTGTRDIRADRRLLELGLDSLTALELRNRLSTHIAMRLPTTMVFDHPTVGELTDFLVSRLAPEDAPLPELDRLGEAIAGLPSGGEAATRVADRLREYLHRLTGQEERRATATLATATDDELFQFIDNLGTPEHDLEEH